MKLCFQGEMSLLYLCQLKKIVQIGCQPIGYIVYDICILLRYRGLRMKADFGMTGVQEGHNVTFKASGND